MSQSDVQRYLAELQARFGAMVQTPLDRSAGQLRAQLKAYPEALCSEVLPGATLSARERLAVYNRQYWFRHFSVLQREYLLCARLLGMWAFNALATRYLQVTPPQHYDLQRVAPGLLDFAIAELAADSLEGVPCRALLQAAQIDAAVSRVFLAPETTPFDPTQAGATLLQLRLQPAAHVAFVEEHWPLVELRRRVQRDPLEPRLALPTALPQPQHWVILRKDQGHAYARIPALAYRLYTLLEACSVGDALAQLEGACSETERAALPAQVQRWLQDGVRTGFWSGAT